MAKASVNKSQNDFEGEMQVNVDILAVSEFQKKIRGKLFFLRDTNVTPRMYNQWRREGLVSQTANPAERKWVSFNLRDYIWVQIVYDLRLMGVSVADIKKAKEICLQSVWQKVDEKTWHKSIDAVIKSVRQNKQYGEEVIKEVEEYYRTNSINKIVSENAEMNIAVLDAALTNIISSGSDWNLYLFLPSTLAGKNKANTDVNEGTPEFKYTTEARKRKIRQSGLEVMFFSPGFCKSTLGVNPDDIHEVPHIKIPIQNYLWEFLLDHSKQAQLGKMELLTPEELKLIEEIRLGNKKEIAVKLNNGEIERIEIVKDLKIDDEKRVMELIMKHEYCDIHIKSQDGKISFFQKSTKKKLK